MLPCRQLLTLVTVLVVSPFLNAERSCVRKFPYGTRILAYDNLCFVFVTGTQLDYDDAQRYCENFHGSLALVKNPKLNYDIASVLHYSLRTAHKFWIGLNDIRVENVFTWVDGSRMVYNNFGYREGYYSRPEDCVAMDYSGLWYDYRCNSKYIFNVYNGFRPHYYNARLNFICQYAPTVQRPTTTTTTTTATKPTTATTTIIESTEITESPATTTTPYLTTTTEKSAQPTQDETTTVETTPQSTPTGTTVTATTLTTTQAELKTTKTNQQPTPAEITMAENSQQITYNSPSATTTRTTTAETTAETTAVAQTTEYPIVVSNPQTTQCPQFTCNTDCGLYLYKTDPDTNCLLCECDD